MKRYGAFKSWNPFKFCDNLKPVLDEIKRRGFDTMIIYKKSVSASNLSRPEKEEK